MSDIVTKFGGTSNATPEAFASCFEQSQDSEIIVTSAPGALNTEQVSNFPIDVAGGVDPKLLAKKVTKLSVDARGEFEAGRGVPEDHLKAIQARLTAIVKGGHSALRFSGWVDSIPDRVKTAVQLGAEQAFIIGEILQAEIYQANGLEYLDPGTAPHSLIGTDTDDERDLWKSWLESVIKPGGRYILPGNITRDRSSLRAFGPGGSDISGALSAYGIGADAYRNMTDTSAQSIDPRILPDAARRRHLDYLTYDEGSELGRNGVGLLHPRAIVPLMGAGIPTEIRNTFSPNGDFTLMTDELVGVRQEGQIVAMSLIPGVRVIKVREPGRSDVIGWAEQHDGAISSQGINLIDTMGDGANYHVFIVDGNDGDKAEAAIRSLGRQRSEISSQDRAFVTLVGHGVGERKLDVLNRLALNTNLGSRDQSGQVIFADHSVRLTLDPDKADEFVDKAHDFFIEREY